MPIKDNLVSYWSMESSPFTDSHGSNTPTAIGTIGTAPGKIGNSGVFSSSYLSIADNPTVQTGDIGFTVAAWVNLSVASQAPYVISRDTVSLREFTLFRRGATSGPFRFLVYGNGNDVVGAVDGPTPSLDTWYYIMCWHDPDANTVNMQVNGGGVLSSSTTGSPTAKAVPLTIGARGDGFSGWNGLLDEVLFAKGVPTERERTFLYNEGLGRSYADLIGFFESSMVPLPLLMGI